MIERICWLLLGAIHLTPALAYLRPSLIGKLYRIGPDDRAFLLLRHRAALFTAIVAVCVWAAFDPGSRPVAVIAAGVSMASFIHLYVAAGSPPPLRTIALTDVAGLAILAFAAIRAFG